MEKEKNSKGIIALLIVIITILVVLCVLLATGTISFKNNSTNNNQKTSENNITNTNSDNNDDNDIINTDNSQTNANNDNNVDNNTANNDNSQANPTNNHNLIKSLINSVKITNLTFDKPHGSKFGGEKSYTLETNMAVNLECTNDSVRGITVKGYCLDTNDTKYLFSGPRGVVAFYCSNDPSYSSNTKFVQAYQLFKADGSNYVIPDKTSDINWNNIEIKYCKFDEAHLILSDYSELSTKIELNYEKEFK